MVHLEGDVRMVPRRRASRSLGTVPLPRLEPMLATRRRQLVLDDARIVGRKLDGWRAVVYMDDDGLMVRTRSGRDVTGSLLDRAGLADVLSAGTVLDGELVAGQ